MALSLTNSNSSYMHTAQQTSNQMHLIKKAELTKIKQKTRNVWQSLACSLSGLSVSPPSE